MDEQLYDLTATTFIPQLTKIKNSDAQAIISWGSGAPAVTITKEYRQLGLTQPLHFSGAQASPLYIKPAGDAANGIVMQCQMAPLGKYLPDSNPSKALITKFDADFMAAYNTPPAQFAYNTNDAHLNSSSTRSRRRAPTPRRFATPLSRPRASSPWTASSTTPPPTTPA